MTLHLHPQKTQCLQYFSCYWHDFDQTLKVGSWDSNCYGDICSGNICPGNICPYQEYLSCYSTHLDETLNIGSWDHLDRIPTVLLKLTLFPTGVVVRMGPWSRINLFVCFLGIFEILSKPQLNLNST